MRKVLSFVLVLSLVLGSFSMAFAATPAGLSDVKGNANEEAITVAYDLGIVTGNPDGTFLPAKTVTRAEFAAMITRALAIPDSALAGYTATTFKDTTGYGWAVPYLAFCNSKGIMLGDGAGNAMPGRTISVNEAVTMALRAVGYTANSAQLVGAWPANYVTLAQNQKLYDDVAAVTTVDKASAAQIVYNLLTVQKVSVNSDGKTDLMTISGVGAANLLNTGLGCTAQAAAVVTGEENSLINLKPYVGDYAIKITKDSSGKVIAIKEVKSTAITGKFKNVITSAQAVTVGGVFTNSDDVEYKNIDTATVIAGFKFFENGENVARVDDLATSKSITINVDLDGKSITEAYSVERWTVNAAAKISDGQVKALANDDVLLGKDFTKDDDKKIDVNSFELVGVKALSDIKKDNVVYVYTKSDGKITKVTVGTEVITGKVTRVNSDGDFTINGKIYSTSSAPSNSVGDVAVGNEIKAWLDASGNIYKAEKTGGTIDNYGVVQFFAAAGINDAQVKLYTQDDTSKTFNIDDEYTTVTKAGFQAAGDDFNTSALYGYAIGYGLDKDGKIETADFRTTTSAVATLSGLKVIQISGSSLAVSDKVVVFTSEAGVGYDLSDISKIKTGANLGAVNLTVDKDGVVVAMVVLKTAATKSADETYGVLNTTDLAYNEELDKNVNQFIGFAGTATLDKLGSAAYLATDLTSGGGMVAPILYKVETDSDGFVKVTASNTKLDARTVGVATIAAINGTYAIQLTGGDWVQLASDVIVYEMKAKSSDATAFDKYVASSADSMLKGYTIYLYDTNTDSGHEGFDYVVFHK